MLDVGIALGGPVVSVLVIEPKVRGLKPGRERWVYETNKNLLQEFLRGGSNALGPCRKILLHIKESYEYESNTFLAKFLLLHY
jgi:hypothetical protein